MEQIRFENLEDMLSSQNADDKGNYFICDCPSCEEHEAFIYKNNLRFITCNRADNCGEKYFVKYDKEKSINQTNIEKMKVTFPKLSENQLKSLDWSERFFEYMQTYHVSPTFEHGYRGISNEVLNDRIVDTQTEGMTKFMFYKMESLYNKKYYESDFMTERNLVLPIYDDNKNLERIVLRSSNNEDIEPKEIQLVANPSKDTRDFFMELNNNSKRIVFTESLFDSLSFKEVDKNTSYVALTGIQKTNRIKDYIKENPQKFKDKKAVIAFDNDDAGNKEKDSFKSFLTEQGIDNIEFDYSKVKEKNTEIKDPNEYLQKNKQEFRLAYKESLFKMKEKSVKKNERELEI